MNTLLVYNLQFPEYVNSLKIDGYIFERVKDYAEAFEGLNHLIDATGGEFSTKPTTGTHQLTAMVQLPEEEQSHILPWAKESKNTRLHDILFFLTVFIGRNVFVLTEEESHLPILQDARLHRWGGELRLSGTDVGLEDVVSQLLQTICSKDWRTNYESGYFLFAYRQAIKQESLEPAFMLCWTIWEHLFAMANKKWLDDRTIRRTGGDKKVAYIMHKYLLAAIDNKARVEIERITRARNRLAHHGLVPDDVDLDEMRVFIRLTEQIIAIVLELKPSNVFNSSERLIDFLKGEKIGSTI